jgi:hypothetical protein
MSFSIIDDKTSAKYKVGFVSIFALSEVNWNNSLKSEAFSINDFNRTVLFTGYLSGFSNSFIQNIDVKIRFNLIGSTNYIYEIINYSIPFFPFHWIIPINFVKKFTTPGLYDVYIESSTFSSGFTSWYDTPGINRDTDKEGIFF